jgi:hypothetical protein
MCSSANGLRPPDRAPGVSECSPSSQWAAPPRPLGVRGCIASLRHPKDLPMQRTNPTPKVESAASTPIWTKPSGQWAKPPRPTARAKNLEPAALRASSRGLQGGRRGGVEKAGEEKAQPTHTPSTRRPRSPITLDGSLVTGTHVRSVVFLICLDMSVTTPPYLDCQSRWGMSSKPLLMDRTIVPSVSMTPCGSAIKHVTI